MSNSLWGGWGDCHDDANQKKRFTSALKAECTPLSVDADSLVGSFSGSSGTYTTALDSCQCADFVRRKLPCKHMYRLAVEVGATEGAAVSDVRRIKAPLPADSLSVSSFVEKIETLPESAQIALKEFLLSFCYHSAEVIAYPLNRPGMAALLEAGLLDHSDAIPDSYVDIDLRSLLTSRGASGFRKNASLGALVKWCKGNAEAASVVMPEMLRVELPARCKKRARSAYSYLIRKYDVEEYYDSNMKVRTVPKGATHHASVSLSGNVESWLSFPDDEITALLDKYGVNPCATWKK